MFTLNSINIGKPTEVPYGDNKFFRSSILRQPINGKIFVDALGLDGDSVANKSVHGGVDKAICLYCEDHFPYWEDRVKQKIIPGAFGENFTIKGVTEEMLRIGDIIQIGDVEIQISQPRQPCQNLVKKFGIPKLAQMITETGFTGFYCRVIQPGWIESGMTCKIKKTEDFKITLSEANRIFYTEKKNIEAIKKVLNVKSLSSSWRGYLQERLDKLIPNEFSQKS